jgi:hypothetical protein
MENVARKLWLQINQGKTKYMIVERKNTLTQLNSTFENKSYKFKRVENFKYVGGILNEDNNHQTHLQGRINKC